MHEIFLLCGGNLNNTKDKYVKLNKLISSHIGKILHQSNYYQSKSWGYCSENNFINVAFKIQTNLSALEALEQCLIIEQLLGRQVHEKYPYQDRAMDIDIIFYDELIFNSKTLTIPHPLMEKRNFVLLPLLEICPCKIHPVLGKTIKELLDNSPDNSYPRPIILQ